jgi:hypothetical protein
MTFFNELKYSLKPNSYHLRVKRNELVLFLNQHSPADFQAIRCPTFGRDNGDGSLSEALSFSLSRSSDEVSHFLEASAKFTSKTSYDCMKIT